MIGEVAHYGAASAEMIAPLLQHSSAGESEDHAICICRLIVDADAVVCKGRFFIAHLLGDVDLGDAATKKRNLLFILDAEDRVWT